MKSLYPLGLVRQAFLPYDQKLIIRWKKCLWEGLRTQIIVLRSVLGPPSHLQFKHSYVLADEDSMTVICIAIFHKCNHGLNLKLIFCFCVKNLLLTEVIILLTKFDKTLTDILTNYLICCGFITVFPFRFCTTGLPSDVTVEVGEMTFHLHKVIILSND